MLLAHLTPHTATSVALAALQQHQRRGIADTICHRQGPGAEVDLLAALEDIDAPTIRANNGDHTAAHRLADLLAQRGDLTTLTARADNGDDAAAWRLATTLRVDDLASLLRLAERGDLAPLTARADKGNQPAAAQLADLLVEGGDLATLTTRANNGDQQAATRLSELQTLRGLSR